MPNGPCIHCGTVSIASRNRGLCYRCYYSPARQLYPLRIRRGVGIDNQQHVLPDRPTTALPGSPEKVAVLEERARLGQALFHPLDVCVDECGHIVQQPAA
jgi:hypothetical protein